MGLGELINQLALAPEHMRMYQLVELFQTLRVSEYLLRQPFPVNGAVLAEDFGSEFAHHVRIGLAAGEQNLMAQLIGLDQVTAKGRQRFADKTFAGSQAAGQTYF